MREMGYKHKAIKEDIDEGITTSSILARGAKESLKDPKFRAQVDRLRAHFTPKEQAKNWAELQKKLKKLKKEEFELDEAEQAGEETLDELSKPVLARYVGRAADDLIGKSASYARRAFGDKASRKNEIPSIATKMTKRRVGIDRALKRLKSEEVELDEGKKLKQSFVVISQQHGLYGEGPGDPRVVHHTPDYNDAHNMAKHLRDKEFKSYPKKSGYRTLDTKSGYHIVTDPEHSHEEGDVYAHSYHVAPINVMKESFSNEDESGTLDEASKKTHELAQLLRKKVKDMSGSELRRGQQLAGKPADKKPSVKEEIEADQNILVHLRKSIDTEGKHETEFADGSKESIPSDVAESVLEHVLRLKPDARLEVQDYLQQSLENVIEVAQVIREGARQS
jgi:hypothetical protein